MTYNVFGGTLNLAQSITALLMANWPFCINKLDSI